jgi:hypothetical protein
MSPEHRLRFQLDAYKAKLEAMRGHNYAYWNKSYDAKLEQGWKMWNQFSGYDKEATTSEQSALEVVEKLRKEGNFARIVCGYEQTAQREKHFTVIYKPKKK